MALICQVWWFCVQSCKMIAKYATRLFSTGAISRLAIWQLSMAERSVQFMFVLIILITSTTRPPTLLRRRRVENTLGTRLPTPSLQCKSHPMLAIENGSDRLLSLLSAFGLISLHTVFQFTLGNLFWRGVTCISRTARRFVRLSP